MNNLIKIITILTAMLIIMQNCSTTESGLKTDPATGVTLRHQGIQLHFDRHMYCTVSFETEGEMLHFNLKEDGKQKKIPSHFVLMGDQVVSDFEIDFDNLVYSDIETNFGKGKRLILNGIAHINPQKRLGKKLTVEIYEAFPQTAIMTAEYTNLSESSELVLSEVYSNCFILDASAVDSSLKPNQMHVFYGTNGRPLPQINQTLPDDFYAKNYTGRKEKLEGIKRGNGGIPVIDLWIRKMGMAIGHIEPVSQNLYLPIEVLKDRKVKIAIREIPAIHKENPCVLKPGDTFKTVQSFVNVHHLDFYEPLRLYSDLMEQQGVHMKTSATDNDYLTSWCTWNDYATSAPASKKDVMLIEPVIHRLKELDEYLIDQVIFDAGWFNNQGDWTPNTDPRAFPGGEADLIKAISEIHHQNKKVMLWISYLTADPWSNVAKEHPDWMIKKSNGDFHLDRWSGYTMCPSLPQVQKYHQKMAERFITKYKADGFKVDGMYTCPPCYNPVHNHDDPNQSTHDYYKVFRAFYEEAKKDNSDATIMLCPCGTICDFSTLPYISQTIASDPEDYITVRRRAKLYRALKGDSTPYSSDYIDLEEGTMHFPFTLANAIGVGSIPQSFMGQSPNDSNKNIYKKWFGIYDREMISQATFLNLYDIYYDIPETYAFKKTEGNQNFFYYSMYADNTLYQGMVEFRGLDKDKQYRVFDYVNDKDIGRISGKNNQLQVSFSNYLLLKCVEIEE